MPTRIVAISHAWGAGGMSIGRGVARRLGFRYVDEEIITLAAEKHGIDATVIADAERRKGLLARLVEFVEAPVRDLASRTGVLVPDAGFGREEHLRAFIIEAIREVADRGHVVIVAHAASILLAGGKDLLRVFVTASVDVRVARLAEGAGGDAVATAKFVEESDAARADYLRRFYRVRHELPTHYDLVLNTDVLDLDEAADIVVAAARRRA